MFGSLVKKELQSIILSPKFPVTFAICSILLLLSVYIGANEYRQMNDQHQTALQLAEERMQQQTSWAALRDRTYRSTDPMHIFVSGLNYDIGRWSAIDPEQGVQLRNSAYSDDPVFAVFRFIDFVFVVQVIFSLFAILFTYDAVNGERESGTLRLVFANSVSRVHYVLAKVAGMWLGLIVPLLVPILLSVLLVLFFGVQLTGGDWTRLLSLMGLSSIYVTFFVVLGVFLSSVTRRSSSSFLLSLVVWIAFVLIIPRAGVMAAGQVVDVPGLAEIESQRDAFAKDKWAAFMKDMETFYAASRTAEDEPTEPRTDEEMWADMMRQDSLRRNIQIEIDRFEEQLKEDWHNRKLVQQRLGFSLSRFSPASALQLAAMTLAGSDIDLKARNEEAMRAYRRQFLDFIEKRQAESGDVGGVMIEMSSETGLKITTSRNNSGLDLAGKPTFSAPAVGSGDVISTTIVDFGILMFGTLLALAAAFVAVLRYDVR